MAIARVIYEPILGCQSVAFDEHALRRMAEGGVTEDEVVEVLATPGSDGVANAGESTPLSEGVRGTAGRCRV